MGSILSLAVIAIFLVKVFMMEFKLQSNLTREESTLCGSNRNVENYS